MNVYVWYATLHKSTASDPQSCWDYLVTAAGGWDEKSNYKSPREYNRRKFGKKNYKWQHDNDIPILAYKVILRDENDFAIYQVAFSPNHMWVDLML